MSQNFGSAKKKWQNSTSTNRWQSRKPCNEGYANQRGSYTNHNWRRSDFQKYGYSRNYPGSSVVEGGVVGGRTTPGVGIFIAPYYTDFGNAQNRWRSGYGYNGFQNNRLDASGDMSERWQPSMNTDLISHKTEPSSGGSWSSKGSQSKDRNNQFSNLRNVPCSFDISGDRSANRSIQKPDQKPGSEVASPVGFQSFKPGLSFMGNKTASNIGQNQGPDTANHPAVHSKVENNRRSNFKASSLKSASKKQRHDHQKVGTPSENSKAAAEKEKIPSLMSLNDLPGRPPDNKSRDSKIAAIIASKCSRMKQLSKVPNVGQRSESSMSDGMGHTASQNAEVSSSGNQDSNNGNVQTSQVGVRPKVDIFMPKKKPNLSKEKLMKLISSPRSRQEHLQLNRILHAHAEKQKASVQHTTTSSETEEIEDIEPPTFDPNGFFKEIEVSALPIGIQREIDVLCQGNTDVNHSERSNNATNIIDLSDIAGEDFPVSMDTPSNARLQGNAPLRPHADASVRRDSPIVSRPQCSSSRVLSSGSGAFSVPSVSRITCQPNVSHSLSTSGTRSHADSSDLPVTKGTMTSTAVASEVAVSCTGFTQTIQSPSPSTVRSFAASTDDQNIVNESRNDPGGVQSLGTLLQISLHEEEIRDNLKETESAITSLEDQLRQLKEQLSVKLILKHKLTEEKVRLRSLRLQILRESVNHQPDDSSAVTPERLSSVPYESIMEMNPSGIDSGFGFDSVLRNGVINIEPVNDDYESGLCYDEPVCPQYENDGTVQLITIAPTDGGEFSEEEDERLDRDSSGHAAAVLNGVTSVQATEPSVAPQCDNDADQVQTASDELNNTVSVHMEYVGTLSTSSLQPEVLQQIALSLQPLDSPRVPFRSSCVASSSVNEFSCSDDDEAVLVSVANDRTVERSGTNERTPEPDAVLEKRTVVLKPVCPSQSVARESEDCIISRVEQRVARKTNRGVGESEKTPGSERTAAAASGKVPSRKRSASGGSPRAVARAQRLASASAAASQAVPVTTQAVSSDTVSSLFGRRRIVPQPVRQSVKPASVAKLLAAISIGDGPAPGADRGGRSDASKHPSTDDPVARKRKSAVSPEAPSSVKRVKPWPVENPSQKKTGKRKGASITSIYPRACPGVLFRHGESTRSIVLGDEVVITASDDGQIIRHPMARQVYGLAEKQPFNGHQSGVVGLITANVQVTRDISRSIALSIGMDQLLKMHCVQTGKVLMTHKFDKILCFDCICEANDTVYVGLDDGSIARITTSSFVAKEPFVFKGSRISALTSFTSDTRSLLLVGFGDCTISVRDASTNFLVQTLRGHVRPTRFILTLNDRIISSSGDCCIFIHCLKSFNTLVNMLHLPSPVVAMTIQAKHELLVVACRDKTLIFIDVKENLRYVTRLSTVEPPITCIAASHHMVYFGCNNGLVHHIDVDMRRHWSCGFMGCKDWFLMKGDLEDHIREDHCGSNLPIIYDGKCRNVCSWHGCKAQISYKKTSHKNLVHFLSHLSGLAAETSQRRSAVTN